LSVKLSKQTKNFKNTFDCLVKFSGAQILQKRKKPRAQKYLVFIDMEFAGTDESTLVDDQRLLITCQVNNCRSQLQYYLII